MDFKAYTILRDKEGVRVRPKNELHFRPIFKGDYPYWKEAKQEGNRKWADFETFANSHTYTLANPEALPENVTEVPREDVDFQVLAGSEWVRCSFEGMTGAPLFVFRAYYSPKQEREEEKELDAVESEVLSKTYSRLLSDKPTKLGEQEKPKEGENINESLELIGKASNVIWHLSDFIHRHAFRSNDELKRVAFQNVEDYFESLKKEVKK